MGKRGQATLLIILGILIVVALIIVFNFREYIFKTSVEQQEKQQLLNEAVKPVKAYLDNCIKYLADDAVGKIGLQAGHIEISDTKEVINPLLPFSRNLDVFGNNIFRVPYWFYETDNGIKKTEVPTIKDMEKEIGNYIDNNINFCVENLTFFQDYEISRFKGTKSNVVIGDKSVVIRIKTSINVNYKGSQQEINDFNTAIDSSLGKLYKIAKNIFDEENRNLFFEDKTYDIISLYKDDIPISGIDFSCSVKTWNYQDIYNNFKQIMSANIPQFKVTGTKYSESDRFYLWKNVISGNYNDVNVNFLYSDNWPTYLDVNPRNGLILKSNGANSGNKNPFLSLLCLQYYNFVYSAKYPILVILTDDNGYTFQFPIQVILKNNQPRENVLAITYQDQFNDQFCNIRVNDISVSIFDENNNPMDNAEINYQCYGLVCSIGETKDGLIKEKFPSCVNGFVIAKKDGYSEEKKEFSTDIPGDVSINLKKIYKKPIKILANGFDLNNDEDAIITFESLENNYIATLSYPEAKETDLISGYYNVSVDIFKKGNFLIKGENKKQCINIPKGNILGLLGFEREQCFDIKLDDLNLDNVVIGRSEFTMLVPSIDLQDDNILTLDVNVVSLPSNYDQLTSSFLNLTYGTYEFTKQ